MIANSDPVVKVQRYESHTTNDLGRGENEFTD